MMRIQFKMKDCESFSFSFSVLSLLGTFSTFISLSLSTFLSNLLGLLGCRRRRRGSLESLSHGSCLGRFFLGLETSSGGSDSLIDGGSSWFFILSQDLLSILQGSSHSFSSFSHVDI